MAHWRVKIEAVIENVRKASERERAKEGKHTLQEFLAGILLEEGLVGDRAVEVVNHEAEDRINLLLGVSGVVREGGILLKRNVS